MAAPAVLAGAVVAAGGGRGGPGGGRVDRAAVEADLAAEVAAKAERAGPATARDVTVDAATVVAETVEASGRERIAINPVAKVVKGGRRFSFNALVAVGDGQGKVGSRRVRRTKFRRQFRKAVDSARRN